MRLTTQGRLLREAVREMLREAGGGGDYYTAVPSDMAQSQREYERKMAEFRAASIPSSLGEGGFVGKSVKLGHLNGDDREALIVGRNSSSDASATQYLVYFSIDPGNISFSDAKMMYPPAMKNVSQTDLDSVLKNSSWSLSQRALDLAYKNMPERFRLITGEEKPWRIFRPIVAHDATDVIMTGGGMILDTMGALAELAPALAARLRDPRVILALGAVKALDKVWTWGGMAASARNIVDSWNGYVDVHETGMMDPENKRNKIEAQSAAVALDVIGFLLSGLALYIDSISKDAAPTSAAAEMFPIALKWSAYVANMGMNAEETLDYVRDIWNDAEDALGPALESALRTATGETRQALQLFDKMIHT